MSEAETSSTQLRIAEAFLDDVGRGLARLDADDLGALGAVPGDALLITGRRATVARAAALPLTHCGQHVVAIDGTTRDNAQVGIDEWVAVRKVPPNHSCWCRCRLGCLHPPTPSCRISFSSCPVSSSCSVIACR